MNTLEKFKNKAQVLGLTVENITGAEAIIVHDEKLFSLYATGIEPELDCTSIVLRESEIVCLWEDNFEQLKSSLYSIKNGLLIKSETKPDSLFEILYGSIIVYGRAKRNRTQFKSFSFSYGIPYQMRGSIFDTDTLKAMADKISKNTLGASNEINSYASNTSISNGFLEIIKAKESTNKQKRENWNREFLGRGHK